MFQKEEARRGNRASNRTYAALGVGGAGGAKMLIWMGRPTSVIGVERTWCGLVTLSANDPKRTFSTDGRVNRRSPAERDRACDNLLKDFRSDGNFARKRATVSGDQ